MTAAEFEAAASGSSEPEWWLTGEVLIHCPEVAAVEGWANYRSPGHATLTFAQRTLLMWADIVGQTANGGLDQFFENYAAIVERSKDCVTALEWPNLSHRFSEAFDQYICDKNGRSTTGAKWRATRERETERIRAEARSIFKKRRGHEFVGSTNNLDGFAWICRMQGAIVVESWEYPAISAFNKWFHSADAKNESRKFVGEFITKNRDQLARIRGDQG